MAHHPRAGLPRHAHALAKITLVLRGAAHETLPRKELICRPGMLCFRAPEEPHSNRYGPSGSEALIIDVPLLAYASFASARPLYEESRVIRGAPARLAARIAHEVREPDDCSPLAAEGLILELLASSVRSRNDDRAQRRGEALYVDRAMEYLEQHRASTVSLAALVTASGMSGPRLVRAFKHHFGVTPATMHRRLRVEWAAEELFRTEKPIAQVATETGFTDQSHLTRLFWRQYGMTPGAYRNRTISD